MYRNGEDYDKIAKMIIEIYIDYGVKKFPVSAMDMCNKLGILLVPYVSFSDINQRNLLSRISENAFYIPATKENKAVIFYNENVSRADKRYNVFHEIKHYVNGDMEENEYDEDMAEYFAKYFMCPIPYLIMENISHPLEIMSKFGVNSMVAEYVSKNIHNRKQKYKDKIFDYEMPLIEHLCS